MSPWKPNNTLYGILLINYLCFAKVTNIFAGLFYAVTLQVQKSVNSSFHCSRCLSSVKTPIYCTGRNVKGEIANTQLISSVLDFAVLIKSRNEILAKYRTRED